MIDRIIEVKSNDFFTIFNSTKTFVTCIPNLHQTNEIDTL